MKSCNLALASLAAMLALAAKADVTAQTPRTTATQNAVHLISRVERAITGYVAACLARDAQRLSSVTTDDVRVEYALDDPGRYLSIDATSLIPDCAMSTPANVSEARVSNLWIFPTHDANAVFVQYDLPAGLVETMSQRQLALVEMRGDRISRMLNFAPPPPSIVAGRRSPGGRDATLPD